MTPNEHDITCPHCGKEIHLVIEREDVDPGRRILPMTQKDADDIAEMKRGS
jgi:hypothetical protein